LGVSNNGKGNEKQAALEQGHTPWSRVDASYLTSDMGGATNHLTSDMGKLRYAHLTYWPASFLLILHNNCISHIKQQYCQKKKVEQYLRYKRLRTLRVYTYTNSPKPTHHFRFHHATSAQHS
jgi:hypothetical protein